MTYQVIPSNLYWFLVLSDCAPWSLNYEPITGQRFTAMCLRRAPVQWLVRLFSPVSRARREMMAEIGRNGPVGRTLHEARLQLIASSGRLGHWLEMGPTETLFHSKQLLQHLGATCYSLTYRPSKGQRLLTIDTDQCLLGKTIAGIRYGDACS